VKSGIELYSTYFIASSLPVSFEYGGNSFDATFSDLSFSKLYLPAIGIKYDWIRNDGFGLNFGLRYEFDRSLEKVSAKFDGQNVGVGGRGFFSFFLFEPNVTFYSEGGYFFFGLNHSLPIFMGNFSDLGEQMEGATGGQMGLGWDWGSNISNISFGSGKVNFEIYLQVVNFYFIADSPVGRSSQASMFGGGLKIGVNYR